MSKEVVDEFNRILYRLYDGYIEEKNELLNKINEQEFRIAEIQNYLDSISEKEDLDYKLFSPRGEDDFYNEKKQQFIKEKNSLESSNIYFQKQLDSIDVKISDIKRLIEISLIYNSYITDTTEVGTSVEEDVQKQEIFITKTDGYRILDIREKEQQRLANDLHDSSLQTLTHLIHKTELCSKYITQDPLRAKLELAVVTKNLKKAVQELRNTIFDLHPMSIDDLGLEQSLENLFTVLQRDSNIRIHFEFDVKESHDPFLLLNIFHIVQESVTNAFKHSEGTKVDVSIKEENEKIYIKVQDDGKGFSIQDNNKKEEKHFGLFILAERVELFNGSLSLESEIGMGTTINVIMKSVA